MLCGSKGNWWGESYTLTHALTEIDKSKGCPPSKRCKEIREKRRPMVLTKYYLRIKRDLNSLHQKVSQVTRMDRPLVYIVVTLYHQDIEQTALLLQKLPLSSVAMLILGSSRGHFPDSRRRFRIFMWATSSTSEGSILISDRHIHNPSHSSTHKYFSAI